MHTASELFPNVEVGAAVTEYSIMNSTRLGDVIDKHRQDTIEFCKNTGRSPYMMINTSQAQFMVFVAKLHQVKKVLEIGCFTGYSALVWAHAVESYPGGEVVTLDLPGEATSFAAETFKKTGTDKTIKLISGDAAKSIETVTGPFDLIFIDANKDGYIEYLRKIISQKLLAPKGFILADNALYRGLVAGSDNNPIAAEPGMVECAKYLDQFNKFVTEDPSLENVLLPAFDGLNLIRFKDGRN